MDKAKIPPPDQLSEVQEEHLNQKIESLRHRVIEMLRAGRGHKEYSLALHNEEQAVVDAIISESKESGWSARRESAEPKYGKQDPETKRVPVIEPGYDWLILENIGAKK